MKTRSSLGSGRRTASAPISAAASLSGDSSHSSWQVVSTPWVRPTPQPSFDPLDNNGRSNKRQPEPSPADYWAHLVERLAGDDPTARDEFNGLYRPAIAMLLEERFGYARAKVLTDAAVERILGRIAHGTLTSVSEMTAEVRQAGARSLALHKTHEKRAS